MSAPIPHHDYVCTCDEGEYCDPCFVLKAAEMRAYFGIRPGMSREERRNQLKAMDPRPVTAEQMAEWQALK